jgi:hypothetical protein
MLEPGHSNPPSVRFIAHYREPLTRSERAAALDLLLASETPIETLLLLRNSFSPAQWARVTQMLEQNPTADPNACIMLARDRLAHHQTNGAIAMLVRAKALAQALGNPGGAQAKVQSLAKEIRPKGELPLDVTPEIYRDLGFIEVTNAPQKLVVEKPLGKPALFFALDRKSRIRTLALRLDPPPTTNAPAPVCCFQSGPGMQSSSSSSLSLAQLSSWSQTFDLGRYPAELKLGRSGDAIRYELTPRPEHTAP